MEVFSKLGNVVSYFTRGILTESYLSNQSMCRLLAATSKRRRVIICMGRRLSNTSVNSSPLLLHRQVQAGPPLFIGFRFHYAIGRQPYRDPSRLLYRVTYHFTKTRLMCDGHSLSQFSKPKLDIVRRRRRLPANEVNRSSDHPTSHSLASPSP